MRAYDLGSATLAPKLLASLEHPMQTPIHFGPYVLNLETGELHKAGSLIRLRPQASRLLALLASRAGTVVSRQDIRWEIWPHGFRVEFELGIKDVLPRGRSRRSRPLR